MRYNIKPEYYLVFDIETVPMPWEDFSESQQEYILRRAEDEEQEQQKKGKMALSPMTGRCICIGLQLMKRNEDQYLQDNIAAFSVDDSMSDEDKLRQVQLSTGDTCHLGSERTVIDNFWAIMQKYNPHLISFNGRNFDAPFLMLRSALLGIRPLKNIMRGTKFNYDLHTDLIDELSFYSTSYSYGATKRFNFDFYARAFGITSPKAAGIDGSKVPEFFNAGRIEEISEYCLRDVTATWELFKVWQKYLAF